jgi:hypothetical protein
MYVVVEMVKDANASVKILTASGDVLEEFEVPAKHKAFAAFNTELKLDELGYRLDGKWSGDEIISAPIAYDNI